MDKHELRRAGLKATLPRLRILQLLEERAVSHMSAEDVYRALLEAGEDVGLATVYRVLTQFEAAGLVSRHHFEGGHSVFELNQGEHHDHIVCSECGHIVEFIDPIIEERQNRVAEEHGFRLADHALVLHGICTDSKCERRGRGR
ncbi:MAG TPA: ferric iron uptake transcriptional regulator [Gammaproteobacteria bacterium]|nr:ferric iron uptake transcriptional regulator [Gammaproteobacteria bacterium]